MRMLNKIVWRWFSCSLIFQRISFHEDDNFWYFIIRRFLWSRSKLLLFLPCIAYENINCIKFYWGKKYNILLWAICFLCNTAHILFDGKEIVNVFAMAVYTSMIDYMHPINPLHVQFACIDMNNRTNYIFTNLPRQLKLMEVRFDFFSFIYLNRLLLKD